MASAQISYTPDEARRLKMKWLPGGSHKIRPRRLVGDRFRRIWYIAEEIAAHPGQSRYDLAEKFHLSERQVQADLNIIRTDMHLPLIRRQGYRFAGEGSGTGPCSMRLQDAQLLVLILRSARNVALSGLRGRLDVITAKLPELFPPHLRPIVARTIEAVSAPKKAAEHQTFSVLAEALLSGSWVTLSSRVGFVFSVALDPVIRPELLIPYLESWYVLGEHHGTHRTVMLRVDDLEGVTITVPRDDDGH